MSPSRPKFSLHHSNKKNCGGDVLSQATGGRLNFKDETKVACDAAEEAKWVDRRNASRVQVKILVPAPQFLRPSFAALIERCSDGGEDQGAEEALWGQERIVLVSLRSSLRSRLPSERLSFQPLGDKNGPGGQIMSLSRPKPSVHHSAAFVEVARLRSGLP